MQQEFAWVTRWVTHCPCMDHERAGRFGTMHSFGRTRFWAKPLGNRTKPKVSKSPTTRVGDCGSILISGTNHLGLERIIYPHGQSMEHQSEFILHSSKLQGFVGIRDNFYFLCLVSSQLLRIPQATAFFIVISSTFPGHNNFSWWYQWYPQLSDPSGPPHEHRWCRWCHFAPAPALALARALGRARRRSFERPRRMRRSESLGIPPGLL